MMADAATYAALRYELQGYAKGARIRAICQAAAVKIDYFLWARRYAEATALQFRD